MKTCGEMKVQLLDLGTRWWVASFKPRPLYPQGKSPWNPLDRGWVGPRTCQDTVEKRKISCPSQELNRGHPACSPLLYWLIIGAKNISNKSREKETHFMLKTASSFKTSLMLMFSHGAIPRRLQGIWTLLQLYVLRFLWLEFNGWAWLRGLVHVGYWEVSQLILQLPYSELISGRGFSSSCNK
jgi:hypothetical protein